MNRRQRIVVGISGASGTHLALALLEMAAVSEAIEEIHLVVSGNALRVAASELPKGAPTPQALIEHLDLSQAQRAKFIHHSRDDVGATIASGSYPIDGMVVAPCSSGTLASIAHGISRGLMQRAADLTLKERRPLILALRETPLSLIHAENIVTVTRAGAIVMPPIPSFYAAQSWDEYHRHFAMRVLDLLGIESESSALRWDGVGLRGRADRDS
jgi:polyprenyl P-hydroxybenzoate/phenylacrylic acid decarboxylase-like protein